jgi:hypothetical protein
LPTRLDPWQLEFLAEDRGEFFERNIDFKQVATARIAARRTVAVIRIAASGNWLTLFAVALPHPTGSVVAKAKMGHVELRNRDADQISTAAADHLAMRHVFAQVLADPAANDLAKAALIALDFEDHGWMFDAGCAMLDALLSSIKHPVSSIIFFYFSFVSPRAKMLAT